MLQGEGEASLARRPALHARAGCSGTSLPSPLQDENARRGRFGFAVDNTIGGTPQPNGWMDDWVAFFGERRLRHQLDAAGDARLSELGAALVANLHRLFEGVTARVFTSYHPITLDKLSRGALRCLDPP